MEISRRSIGRTWHAHLVELVRQSGPDQWIGIGDLFACLADEIPLHQASRLWRKSHADVGLPDEMRWHAFTSGLNHYRFTHDPPKAQGRRVLRSTRLRPDYATCAQCGQAFFSSRKTISCGTACGNKLPRRRDHEINITVRRSESAMARLPDSMAIEVIIEALMRLPDAAARNRVMTFVNAYTFDITRPQVEAAHHVEAPQPNSEAHDATP
jgi:predicted  nucleic acid-binding Zn-ribbon protein